MARPPPPGSGGPPVSFKTVPGRHRTQKWNTAKSYDYSGGDWGGYDPYDDYGADEQPPPMPSQQSQGALPSQQQGHGYPRQGRQQSFDNGDETRAFSGPSAFPSTEGPPGTTPAPSAASGERPSNDYPRPSTAGKSARDFTNPEQVPPPLNTAMRASPAPGQMSAGGVGFNPPPRKSSVSSSTQPTVDIALAPPVPTTSKDEKELPTIPFIRPSDIYKRMEAEKEKERKSSLDSNSRPSLSDLEASRSPSQQRPLSSVEEMGELGNPTETSNESVTTTNPSLPTFKSEEGWGENMFGGANSAAEIAAERTHAVPVSATGRQPPDSLSHQPSSGYRSMVHQAFDTSDVSRSNTTSTSNTSGISPIIGTRPAFEPPVGTIPEEAPRKSGESNRIARKPSPSSSVGIVQPGYRRSLDPPSHDNSPARTPGIDDANRGRSLSGGFTAETADDAFANEGVPSTGRPRAGTDYSIREADLAREVDSSPDKGAFEPEVAQQEKAVQDEYLQNHPSSSHGERSDAAFDASSPTRSASPSKSRVRQLADQYQSHDDANRRSSQTSIGGISNKSSWSNFRGSDENLPGTLAAGGKGLPRHASDASNVVSESDYAGVEESGIRDSSSETGRPPFDREQSFRPQLPGQWVSSSNILATTAAAESGGGAAIGSRTPEKTPRNSRGIPSEQEPVDLTPTTRKVQLPSSSPDDSNTRIDQTKTAGSALGAALLASVGQGHQTRDFGSASTPAKEVEIPSSRNATGEIGYLQRPELGRGVTDASVASTVTAASQDTVSAAPTPTPPLGKEAELPSASSEGSDLLYAGAAVAPLSLRREGSPAFAGGLRSIPAIYDGSDYGGSGLRRDDSTLRREIVRSLDGEGSPSKVFAATQNEEDDVARTQDALDAPYNQRQVASGGSASPPREVEKPLPGRPMMLDQRFSWEANTSPGGGSLLGGPSKPPTSLDARPAPVPKVLEPESPEIKPEMPYERPRSRGLHIVNADSDDEGSSMKMEPSKETGTGLPVSALAAGGAATFGVAAAAGVAFAARHDDGESGAMPHDREGSGFVSPITKSQDQLGSMGDLSVSSPPAAEDGNKGYLRDAGGLEVQEPMPVDDNETYAPAGFDAVNTSSPDLSLTLPTALPAPPEKETTASPTTPTTSKTKIPPFREILALKTPSARIETYDSTRQTFAEMHTGLSDWVGHLLDQNPEYASLASGAPPLQTSGTYKPGHKASPSLAKFTPKQFGFGSGGDMQRSQSVSASGGGLGGDGDGMEKLQLKGKELMKGAGMLGGKAQAGAKGLFAKGRSRFGTQREGKSGGGTGGKAPPPTPTYPSSTVSPTPTVTAIASGSSSHVPTDQLLPSSTAQPATSSNVQASSVAPPPRSQTQTPSSFAASPPSRPLSRTLSRLRDRSRSLSRSLSRSQSRPTSLVLTTSNTTTNPNINLATPTATAAELATVLDASPHQPSHTWDRDQGHHDFAPSSSAIISPWSEPGDPSEELDFAELEVMRAGTPGRLGILPSPTGESFVGSFGEGGRRNASTANTTKEDHRQRDGTAAAVSFFDPSSSEGESVQAAGESFLEPSSSDGEGVRAEGKSFFDPSTSEEEGEASTIDNDGNGLESNVEGKQSILERVETDFDALPSQRRKSAGRDSEATPRQSDFKGWETAIGQGFANRQSGNGENDGEISRPLGPESSSMTGQISSIRGWSGEDTKTDHSETAPGTDRSDILTGLGTNQIEEKRPVDGTGASTVGGIVSREAEEDYEDLYTVTPVVSKSSTGVYGLESNVESRAASGAVGGVSTEASEDPSSVDEMTDDGQEVENTDKALPRLPHNIIKDKNIDQDTGVNTRAADARSEISSNEDFGNAQQDRQLSSADDVHSRRSSVSSIAKSEEEAVPMSAQAVPAGPFLESGPVTAIPSHPPQDDSQDTRMRQTSFVDRPYIPARPELERPHSYMELGTDEDGMPVQETIDTRQTSSSNLMAGDRPVNQSGLQGLPPLDTTPKRRAGVTKGRRPTLTSPTTEPSASQITDQYGLEDLSRDVANVDVGEHDSAFREPESVDRGNKRRSGVWSALKRTSSRRKSVVRRDDVLDGHDSQQPLSNEIDTRGISQPIRPTNFANTPQQISTTAAEPEGKKKRFSGLGSLFSRSSTTTGRKLEKRNKSSGRQPSVSEAKQEPNAAVAHDMQEARRRQQFPNLQARLPDVRPASVQSPRDLDKEDIPPVPPVPQPSEYEGWRDPPPGGWYAPQSAQYQPPSVSQQPQFRQLQFDQTRRTSMPLNWPDTRPPEEPYSRATDVSPLQAMQYGSSASQAIGSQRPIYSQMSSSNSYGRRHSSYIPDGHQLSPQISGQSDWEESTRQQRGSSFTSISPVQSRPEYEGMPPPRQFRVGSISEEVERPVRAQAMSPDSQQTPWAISIPQPREPPPSEGYVWESADGNGFGSQPMTYQPRGMPVSPGWRGPGSRRPPQKEARRFPDGGIGGYYPSPTSPRDTASRAGVASEGTAAGQEPQRPPSQSESLPRAMQTTSNRPTAYALPNTERRVSSGYSGRRDDPTVSEEAVIMRGVSYPGQEWSPQQWE